MKTTNTFISTRNDDLSLGVSFKEALLNPAAPLGGLYTFNSLPSLSHNDIIALKNMSYEELCTNLFEILNLGLEQEVLAQSLQSYKSFDNPLNPAPITTINENLFMLNLFSGPTRAFKDMALQPFGALLSHFAKESKKTYLILVATSGDTGPATLYSFANKPYIKVVCLYPYGGTSEVQKLQMTTQDAANCKVIGIKGNFDDAQNAIKTLLNDTHFIGNLKSKGIALSASNSVNIGRIVFQMVYYFWAYIHLYKNDALKMGEKLSVIVPSGNFGNILGAFFAKKMGLPLGHLVVASNVNNILSDFISSGVYDISKRKLLKSKSPAMDILKSSNVERVLYALFGAKRTAFFMESLATKGSYTLDKSELELLQTDFLSLYCDDEQCLQSVAKGTKNGLILDPHSAIAYYGANKLQKEGRIGKSIFLATAEWSKFAPSVWESLARDNIFKTKYTNDKEAIKDICAYMKITNPSVSEIFDKKELQQDVIPISQIPSCIMQWLNL